MNCDLTTVRFPLNAYTTRGQKTFANLAFTFSIRVTQDMLLNSIMAMSSFSFSMILLSVLLFVFHPRGDGEPSPNVRIDATLRNLDGRHSSVKGKDLIAFLAIVRRKILRPPCRHRWTRKQ